MDSFRHMCKTQVGGTMRQITAHARVCGHTSTCSVYSMCICKFPTEGRSIYSTEMGHYMCHPIIRSLGPWGAHKGPCSNFIMIGLNVWHMHCWHNNWVSLNYLITKHVWWGRDGREQIVKVWASARKIQENNHACVHTQRTLKHHTRSNSEMQNSLSPPYAPPPHHSSSVLDKRTCTYTHTSAQRVSRFKQPQWAPAQGDGVRRSCGHTSSSVFLNHISPHGLSNSSSSFKNARLPLCVNGNSKSEVDLCRQDSFLRRG